MTIHMTARRFHCLDRQCARRTFAERLTDVVRALVAEPGDCEIFSIILASLCGEAGARLATRLAAPTSPDTLLRLASARPCEATIIMPRVLGIDDWAWRSGRRYGTVLVNLETNEVVDILPDREAATVADWLRDRPGVEIVARDRAGASYSDGIRQGAPGAIQVADRWHLLRNLGEAVQALGDRHSAAVRRAAQHVRASLVATQVPDAGPTASSIPAVAATVQPAGAASRARRQARYEEAARLRGMGVTITRISAELGACNTGRFMIGCGSAMRRSGSSRLATASLILSNPSFVVLPHVILLPAASPRMLPATRREASAAR